MERFLALLDDLRRLHRHLDLAQVLPQALALVQRAIPTEAAALALLDPDTGDLVFQAATGPGIDQVVGMRFSPTTGLTGQSVLTNHPLLVRAPQDALHFHSRVDSRPHLPLRELLCIPLSDAEERLGVIQLLNRVDGSFGDDDVDLLSRLATEVVIVIQNARRYEKERRRRRVADALLAVSSAQATTVDLEALLNIILEQLGRVVPYVSAAIFQVDESGQGRVLAQRGFPRPDMAEQAAKVLGVDTRMKVLRSTGRPLLIADTHHDPRWPALAGWEYVRCWIGVPLLDKQRFIGVLSVDSGEPASYGEEEISVVSAFAQQALLALQRFHAQQEAERATAELATNARRMSLLYETSHLLLSHLQLNDEKLEQVVRWMAELTQARYCALHLLPASGQEERIIVHGIDESYRSILPSHPEGAGLLGHITPSTPVVRSDDLSKDSRVQGFPPHHPRMHTFLGVPVTAQGRLLARFYLADKQEGKPFTAEDEALAKAFAATVATALENTRLFQESQQRLRELKGLYEISRALGMVVEPKELYGQIVAQIAELMDVEICAIFTLDPDREEMLVCQPPAVGLTPEQVSRLRFPLRPETGLQLAWQETGPRWANRPYRERDLAPFWDIMRQLGIRQILGCNLWSGHRSWGMLAVANKRDGSEITEADARLISTLAHQAAAILEKVHLQRKQREEAEITAALLEVSQAINDLIQLGEILERVTQITPSLVGCDCCLIHLWDAEQERFLPAEAAGLTPEQRERFFRHRCLPADVPYVTDEGIPRKTPLVIRDTRSSSQVPEWLRQEMAVRSLLAVPILSKDHLVGGLLVYNSHTSRTFSEQEIAIVTGIAHQTAIAIENARLYQELQKRAQELERAYEELKDLDRMKSEFIQNVSHELRTPLTFVRGYVELLLSGDLGPLNQRQRESLEIVAAKSGRLAELVNDVITLQTVDADSLERSDVPLSLVARSAMRGAAAKAKEAGLTLQEAFEEPENTLVYGDPHRLEQVFDNLLSNAIKFSSPGSTITVRIYDDGDVVRAEVEDQGIGIPEEALPHIFDRFYQVDGSTTRRYEGTGLGLAIVKQIVEAHGGAVGVESQVGEGSRFWFTIPKYQDGGSET